MEAAVLQNGEALRYASERCQANREIVALAVENTPVALIYSAIELQDDTELTGTWGKKQVNTHEVFGRRVNFFCEVSQQLYVFFWIVSFVSYLPGTLNNHFLMGVWWNNHFLCNDMESSSWNSH